MPAQVTLNTHTHTHTGRKQTGADSRTELLTGPLRHTRPRGSTVTKVAAHPWADAPTWNCLSVFLGHLRWLDAGSDPLPALGGSWSRGRCPRPWNCPSVMGEGMHRSGTRRGARGLDCGLGLRWSGKASCRRSHLVLSREGVGGWRR